jgi:hypothetical protein
MAVLVKDVDSVDDVGCNAGDGVLFGGNVGWRMPSCILYVGVCDAW